MSTLVRDTAEQAFRFEVRLAGSRRSLVSVVIAQPESEESGAMQQVGIMPELAGHVSGQGTDVQPALFIVTGAALAGVTIDRTTAAIIITMNRTRKHR